MFQKTFKALSDPIRQEILELLKDGNKLNAGEIASKFELTQATVSYHLSILKKADLIREEKEENYIYYSLNASVLQQIICWFNQFGGKENEK